MEVLNNNQIDNVSAGSLFGSGASCIGGIGATIASEGWAATFSGIATAGACYDFGKEINDSVGHVSQQNLVSGMLYMYYDAL